MSLICSRSSVAPSVNVCQTKLCNMSFLKRYLPSLFCSVVHYKFTSGGGCDSLRNKLVSTPKFTARNSLGSGHQKFTDVSLNWEDQEQDDGEDIGSPWEGAIIYKRNPSVSHVEYCTTLERLGLAKLSTDVSKSRASVIGLRVTKAVKDYPLGTPVQISMDVTRKKQKLRLDGIIKTVISLHCNRCCEPTAESVYSNFSLLLTEEPIEEPDVINLGVIFGEDKFKSPTASFKEEDDDDDEAFIDWDDRLHFPPEDKQIDISKPIRDMVHVEVTINAICDPSCKGLCLKCGTNLNKSTCNCSEKKVKERDYGPFKNLRKQMQSKA